jgi:Tol biopolymer transport system component
MKWSPNGKRMLLTAVTKLGSSIWIADADGSHPRQISPEFDFVTGAWLNDDLLLIDAVSGETQPSTIDDGRLVNYVLDLKDGTVQVYSRDLQLAVVPIVNERWMTLGNRTGLRLHNLESHATPVLQEYYIDRYAFDVSPSGYEMVFFDSNSMCLYKATLEGDNVVDPILVYALDDLVTAGVGWSPDGKYIALLDVLGNLYIFDTSDFSLTGEFDVGGVEDTTFIWSPHSDAILVSRRYGKFSNVSELVRVDVQNGAITQLTDNDTSERMSDWRIIAR